MLTGILAVRNLAYSEENDLWNVNADGVYHEESVEEISLVDQDMEPVIHQGLRRVFPKLDRVALGLSIGTAAGVLLSAATLVLVLKGGEVVGPNLQLLSQIFPGYRVTLWGSLWGLGYGFVAGFFGGWGFALLRNAAVFISAVVIQRRAERIFLRRILEYL